MNKVSSKLGLGTAQFGLNYGSMNNDGRVEDNEIIKILQLCNQRNIHFIDTADAYGVSIEKLIELLPRVAAPWKITTKIGPFSKKADFKNYLKVVEKKTLPKLLQFKKIYACYVHHGSDLLQPEGREILELLRMWKNQNYIERIGVSVNEYQELLDILDWYSGYIDIIQVPFSIWDQRFKHVKELFKKSTKEIHVRSIFLQGLLLHSPDLWPNYIPPKLKSHGVNYWKELNGENPLSCALQFIKCQDWIDQVIIGVNKASQLEEITNIFHRESGDIINFPFESYSIEDESLILPMNWSKPRG